MAAKATNKGRAESFITYEVVKAHDGLKVGEEVVRPSGHKGAEYCVRLGLWRRKAAEKEVETEKQSES